MDTNYLKLEDIKPYVTSRKLSKLVWEEVIKWEYLSKRSIGDQFVRSTDSIGANIAEGFGRHHKKDKIKFYYNARGSIYESIHWVELANERELISKKTYDLFIQDFIQLPREINYLIKVTNEKLKI